MPDFDTQLNQILSNPAAMAEIAKLAQSLSAPAAENPSVENPPSENLSAENSSAENSPSENSSVNDAPPEMDTAAPQNGAMPLQNSGTIPTGQNGGRVPTGQNGGATQTQTDAPQSPGTMPPFSGTTNAPLSATTNAPFSGMASLPPELLTQFLPLFRQLNSRNDSNARRLLYALRPYLPTRRQEKIERALQFAKIWCMGKNFLSKRGENDV